MAWSFPVVTPAGSGLSCNTYKLSDEACIAEIARLYFPGDRSLLNDEDPLRKCGDEIEVLFDQDHGQPALAAQPQQGFDDLVDNGGLDAFGRVGDQAETRAPAKAPREP